MDMVIAKKIKRYWQLYLFLLLPITYIIIFKYIPMTGLQLAFKKYTIDGGIWNSPWIGFNNFRKLFSSYQFERIMVNTVRLSVYGIFAGFPFPIVFALSLNCVRYNRLKKGIQTITYIPHFISTIVIVGMMNQILHSRIGIYGILMKSITGEFPRDIFANPNAFSSLYVWSGIWQEFGWGSIIYLAALSSVSDELHDAAKVDGANRFLRVIHVDLPALLPTIIIMLILRMGSVMNIGFEKIYLMQNDLNLRVSEVISTYTYKQGLGSGGRSDYSYATAIGFFNSVINFVLLVIVNRISRKVSDISLW